MLLPGNTYMNYEDRFNKLRADVQALAKKNSPAWDYVRRLDVNIILNDNPSPEDSEVELPKKD